MKSQWLYTLDENGEPVPCDDILKWSEWYGADRTVANDVIDNLVIVSTVFLGIDHSFSRDGAPLLWETRVFEGPLDGETHRYTSHEAALSGHAEMMARVFARQHADRTRPV